MEELRRLEVLEKKISLKHEKQKTEGRKQIRISNRKQKWCSFDKTKFRISKFDHRRTYRHSSERSSWFEIRVVVQIFIFFDLYGNIHIL